MNIETIGKELAALNDKIKDEKDLGDAAKKEILAAVSHLSDEIASIFQDAHDRCHKAFFNLHAAVPDHMDGRAKTLNELMVEPVKPDIAKVA